MNALLYRSYKSIKILFFVFEDGFSQEHRERIRFVQLFMQS